MERELYSENRDAGFTAVLPSEVCGASARAEVPRISLVIPALNEAPNLPALFHLLPRYLHEVILVDGGSSDGTVEIARGLCPAIRIINQTGRGKGNALALGFAACTGDIIITIDADGSINPHEIPLLADALLGGADFARGSRFLPTGGSADMTLVRAFGNVVLTRAVNVLFATRYTDVLYGFSGFWRRHTSLIDVQSSGFEVEPQINIHAARAGLRMREIPSFEARRGHGESKLRAFRDGLRIVRLILLERVRYHQPHRPSSPYIPDWDGADRRINVIRRTNFAPLDQQLLVDERRFVRRWADVAELLGSPPRGAPQRRRRGMGSESPEGRQRFVMRLPISLAKACRRNFLPVGLQCEGSQAIGSATLKVKSPACRGAGLQQGSAGRSLTDRDAAAGHLC